MSHKVIQKKNIWSILFVVSIIIEILLLSKFKNIFGVYISPIVILVNNFSLVFIAFKIKETEKINNISISNNKTVLFSFYFVLTLIIAYFLNQIFHSIPITSSLSDIIPTLQKYNTRLLLGEFPYKAIQYEGWTVIPNYMPMQWLPFIIAEILNFDYRWISYAAFVLINFMYWKHHINRNSLYENLFKAFVPFFFLFLLLMKDNHLFGSNVELLLVAYYMFLAFSIKNKNYKILGFGIVFCLLSRFSLIFWLPLYAFMLFKKEDFKFIFKVGLTVLIGVIFIYVIPFLSKDPYIFTNGLKYYSQAAVGEWLIKDFQQIGEIPFHLGQGVGFAVYFYEFATASLEENLNLAKYFHVLISLFTVAIGFIIFHFKKFKIATAFLILLSFKVYLSVFYAFIHIPYVYLQLVPLFISVALLFELNLFPQNESKE